MVYISSVTPHGSIRNWFHEILRGPNCRSISFARKCSSSSIRCSFKDMVEDQDSKIAELTHFTGQETMESFRFVDDSEAGGIMLLLESMQSAQNELAAKSISPIMSRLDVAEVFEDRITMGTKGKIDQKVPLEKPKDFHIATGATVSDSEAKISTSNIGVEDSVGEPELPVSFMAFAAHAASLGFLFAPWNDGTFGGVQTDRWIDALYLSVVTVTTVGYGDLVPTTDADKVAVCVLAFSGIGIVTNRLASETSKVLDKQEKVWLREMEVLSAMGDVDLDRKYLDHCTLRWKKTWTTLTAIGSILAMIAIGIGGFMGFEGLPFVDAFYASTVTVTTVGFGDFGFETNFGRIFATFWLLTSTLTVAWAFGTVAEATVEERRMLLMKRQLKAKVKLESMMESDFNHDGRMDEAEFIIIKLKDLGKIDVEDLQVIRHEFRKIDKEGKGWVEIPNVGTDKPGT